MEAHGRTGMVLFGVTHICLYVYGVTTEVQKDLFSVRSLFIH